MKKSLILAVIFILSANLAFAAEKQDSNRHYDPEKLPETFSPLLEGQTSFDEPGEYKKLSLEEAINFALKSNLDLKGNRLDLDIATQNIKAASKFQNPNIETFFNTGKAGYNEPNVIRAVLPIDILKRGARKKLATSNLELTKDDVALSELDLRLQVRKAYVNLATKKSELKILEENKKILNELNAVAQKRYKSKKVNEMDLIQTKMILNQLEIEINLASANVKIAKYNFNKLLNSKNYDTKEDYLPEENDFRALLTPKPTESIPDFKAISEITLKKRLDLRKAEKDIDVSQKNLALVLKQRIPDLEIGAGYLFCPPGKSDDDRYEQGVYIGGGITNIPLFYQYSPEIKNATTQVEQKQIAYKSLKKKALTNLHSAYDQFTTAQKNLNYYNSTLLVESEHFLDVAKKSYESGKSNIIDFILVQQAYKSILIDYTTALANYYDSWINMLGEIKGQKT